MKKILMLTPIYPARDVPGTDTRIVHFFTKEWVKLGYQVQVIHFASNFPSWMYRIADPFANFISSRVGFMIRKKPLSDLQYVLDGVNVTRVSLHKLIPHSRYKKKEIYRAVQKAYDVCNKINFSPDYIVGHWANPQLEIIHFLKNHFKAKTALILHDYSSLFDVYGKDAIKLLADIDIVGYRSKYIKLFFEERYKCIKESFMCYSGIPDSYVSNSFNRKCITTKDLIYVGTLIKRKYPVSMLDAVANCHSKESFKITYIGDGPEKKNIVNRAKELSLLENISLYNHLSRNDVQALLRKNSIFIMISKSEAFGLVYLEAMNAGCITIASRNEGFDGIIEDGVNGFLCESGNAEELSTLLSDIQHMTQQQLLEISNNAIKTAQSLTESKVALNYINTLEN